MADTFTLLIRRISYDMIHYSIIPPIIQYGMTANEIGDDTPTSKAARNLLQVDRMSKILNTVEYLTVLVKR